MGKKNLEQLFREKLGDFHEIPDEKVWKSIEASLDKKKRKRVVPIWWRLGGVAAVLAILLYVIGPFGNKDIDGQIIVSETESTNTSDQDKSGEVTPSSVDFEDEKLVDSQNEVDSESPQNTVADIQEDESNSIHRNQSQNTAVQSVVSNSNETNTVPSQKKKADEPLKNALQNSAVAEVNTENEDIGVEKNGQDLISSSKGEAVARNEKAENPIENKAAVNITEEQLVEKEAVALQEEENNTGDKQSIFEAIAEQEEEVVAQNEDGKWSVGPSVAPVYFSASGEGSPVHSTFAANTKSGNVDLSYGLTVAYNLGKKLKVRTGVHRVNYGYDTNDVVFTSSLDGSINLIDNIDYRDDSQNIVLESKNQGALSLDKAEFASASSAVLDGKMVQQLGYLEVPLELNYSLIDNKFGVDLIGGVSSLFLVDNSVLLESEGLVTEVGEANNVNSMNFSTNVGVGFNYEFSPKVQLNVEPVFKYQLNTFSDTSGSFRPFSVGVYSGISIKL